MTTNNTELVQALKRILADSELVIKMLAENAGVKSVDSTNLQSVVTDLDSTSGSVVLGLFNVLDDIEDAIEQFDN